MVRKLIRTLRSLRDLAAGPFGPFAAWARTKWAGSSARAPIPEISSRDRLQDVAPSRGGQGLAGSLAALARRTDPDFARLASDLKALHATAFELGRSVGEHAGAVRDTLRTSRLNGPDGTAARSLACLQSGMDAAGGNLAALKEVAGSLGRLHSQGAQIRRIAMILKSSGCTFAVESARSTECQVAFGSFVEELRSLAEKIATLGATIGDQSRDTQASLEGLTGVITGDLEQLRQLTRRSETTVRQTAEQMQRLMDSSCAALQEAEKRSRDIARHADDVVFHLQFGDNVRQRLEHVVSSLEDAASKGGASDRAERAALILDLQIAQLDAIGDEVEETRRQLLEAFEGLAGESASLGDGVRGLGGDDREGKSLFDELRNELLRLEELQRQGHVLCVRANETSQQAIASAASLSQHLDKVQDINREMHLQALNAIIKTALLGDQGRTLEVLSTHVHAVFQESSGLVGETVGILEAVRSSAHGTARSDDTDRSQDDDLKSGLARIAGIHGEFTRIGASALELVERQNARLEDVRGRLGFLAELTAQLAAFAADVRQFRKTFPELKPGMVTDDDLVSVTRRYTMESERAVHRRILGFGSSGTKCVNPVNETTSTMDDSIDLFDAPAGPAEPVAVAQAQGSPERPHDFGDNIDLF